MKLLLLMIALMPFVEHGCVSQLPQKAHGAVEETEIKCKKESSYDGCNTCTHTVCTDGKTQWTSGVASCTAAYCETRHDEKPLDKNLWEKK